MNEGEREEVRQHTKSIRIARLGRSVIPGSSPDDQVRNGQYRALSAHSEASHEDRRISRLEAGPMGRRRAAAKTRVEVDQFPSHREPKPERHPEKEEQGQASIPILR